MKRRFLKYQLELVGTKEDDLTEYFQGKLKHDLDNHQGIYNQAFGMIGIGKSDKSGNLVLCGRITARNQRICKGVYSALKIAAMKRFPQCTEASDMLIITGSKSSSDGRF